MYVRRNNVNGHWFRLHAVDCVIGGSLAFSVTRRRRVERANENLATSKRN